MNYYEKKFKSDLVKYCENRNDLHFFGYTSSKDTESSHRKVRLGTNGWLPVNQIEFYFSLYFTVLTDMAIHCHFYDRHNLFDQKAKYPKLYGIGVYQRLLPIAVLPYLKFPKDDLPKIENLWRNYCSYFIQSWQKLLPEICDIDGFDFFNALVKDNDILKSLEIEELKYETKKGSKHLASDKKLAYNTPAFFENSFIIILKENINRLSKSNKI